MKFRTFGVAVALFILPALLFGGDKKEWLPGGTYNPAVTRPADVLGYEIGDYLTDHNLMLQYFAALAKSSDRVKLFPYGRSLEGRKMILAVISAPDNLARLGQIRQNIARLTDPTTLPEPEVQRIIAETPAVAWLNYANDGNESAAFETAMLMAYQLAAGTDKRTQAILKNLVVIINPAHNPESHQRFVTWYKAAVVGPKGTADPQAAEHRGDWLMDTNNNHYQIDLNRDAFILSQHESRLVAEQFHRWNPQLFIDHHGQTKEFFFPPNAPPVNQNLPPEFKKWTERIGRHNARACDRFGWSYYTSQHFDLFYPGFWDSYPSLNGAIGMTYETDAGGRNGLVYEKPDGYRVTLREGIHKHFIGGFSALETCAQNRRELLRYFYNFRKTGIQEARKGAVKGVFLLTSPDPGRTRALLELLNRHHIEFYRLQRDVNLEKGRTYFEANWSRRSVPSGAFWIPFEQPQARLVRTLFEPDPQMDPAFLEQARRNREYNHKIGKNVPRKRLGFYDITAWALPLLYRVDAFLSGQSFRDLGEKGALPLLEGGIVGKKASFAYVFSGHTNAATRLFIRLMQNGYRVSMATSRFFCRNKPFGPGSYIVRAARNPADLHAKLAAWAKELHVQVWASNTAWDGGRISMASPEFLTLKPVHIAVVTGPPTAQTGYGGIWCLLEREYGVRFTALRLSDWAALDLNKYNVLVLPDGSAPGYRRALGKEGIEKLRQWIRGGGTLVAVKGAAEFAAADDLKLTTARVLPKFGERAVPAGTADSTRQGTGTTAAVEATPGALLKVHPETDYYLTCDYAPPMAVLIYSNLIFQPSSTGMNAIWFDRNPRISGFVWKDMLPLFENKAYLVDEYVGRGHVVLFADDPTFRLFQRGLDRLFLRALFVTPSVQRGRGH